MTTVRIAGADARAQHGTALIADDDSVWVVVCPAWWDLASLLWWWLAPVLRTPRGHVRARAIRVSGAYARIGGVPR